MRRLWKLPPGAPWTDITFAGVYWHEEKRLPELLRLASRWFTHLHLGVQDDGEDDTLAIAAAYDPLLVVDRVHGLAEPTLNRVVSEVKTPWTLVISGDEMPSDLLLSNMQMILGMAYGDDYSQIDGFWIPFTSTIEGIEYPSEQDRHLRLFETHLGWPTTMHSRPPARYQHMLGRETGDIRHDRTLTEMATDYIRYMSLSGENTSWAAHNRTMLHDACAATAQHHGWASVRSYDWWPDAERIAFSGCVERCAMPQAYDCKA